MKEQIYKIEDYTGSLPNPRTFPTKGCSMVAFSGYPNMFSDGFMTDLSVSDTERIRLEKKTLRTVSKNIIDGFIKLANEATILLPEPQYIYVGCNLSYLFKINELRNVGMQIKYYRYFRNRYPKCSFLVNNNAMVVNSTKHDGKLVGLWMEVVVPALTK